MGQRHGRARSHKSGSSSSSAYSHASSHSRSTAPTEYSVRPVLTHYHTGPAKYGQCTEEPLNDQDERDRRNSVETYASTVPSEDDLPAQREYDLPVGGHEVYSTDALPTTPSDFAELFPSNRKLLVAHDDATSDGNMNLRVDTIAWTTSGREQRMILFHLRMQDLKDRKFSLRRYCRESGREICHSSRKYVKPPLKQPEQKRPLIQRSLSSALQSLGVKSNALVSPRHRDYGFASAEEDDDLKRFSECLTELPNSSNETVHTNTLHLEFSNYAQVAVHRRGTRSSKRYEYEYWGASYQWQRRMRKDGDLKEVSYHLIDSDSQKWIAHITPEPLSRKEAMEEELQGGWVPPCSMVITDQNFLDAPPDIAE